MRELKISMLMDAEDDDSEDLDDSEYLKAWGFRGSNCDCCGVSNSKVFGLLMQCAKCRNAYYCSAKCFNEHLPEHAKHCSTNCALAREPVIKIDGIKLTSKGIEKVDQEEKEGETVVKEKKTVEAKKTTQTKTVKKPRVRAKSATIVPPALPVTTTEGTTDSNVVDDKPLEAKVVKPKKTSTKVASSSAETAIGSQSPTVKKKNVKPRSRSTPRIPSSIEITGSDTLDKPKKKKSGSKTIVKVKNTTKPVAPEEEGEKKTKEVSKTGSDVSSTEEKMLEKSPTETIQ